RCHHSTARQSVAAGEAAGGEAVGEHARSAGGEEQAHLCFRSVVRASARLRSRRSGRAIRDGAASGNDRSNDAGGAMNESRPVSHPVSHWSIDKLQLTVLI